MVKLLLVAFFSLFSEISWSHPIGPRFDQSLQLGSELSFVSIGNGATTGAVASIARSSSAVVVAITSDGKLWMRHSAAYAGPWFPTCGTFTVACYSTYQPSGQLRTNWAAAWQTIFATTQFDAAVKPVMIMDSTGTTHLFASTVVPDRRLVHLTMGPAAINFTMASITSRLSIAPTHLSATIVGGKHGVTNEALLLGVTSQSGIFSIYERSISSRTPTWAEKRIQPPGSFQVSEFPISVQSYGVGNQYAGIFFASGGVWEIQYLKVISNGATELLDRGSLSGVAATQSPKILWLPGNYIIGIYEKAGKLYGGLGLAMNHRIGFPAGRLISDQDLVPGNYKIISSFADVFVLSLHQDRTLKMHRLGVETARSDFQLLSSNPITSDFVGGLDTVEIGQEVYAIASDRGGTIRWINALRASAQQMSDRFEVFHFSPSTQGIPYSATLAFASFGRSFWAMPLSYHSLYTDQPADRCHPGGFTPPIVCGKVFIEWNDYWGTPTTPGTWQTREIAVGTLGDTDTTNDWPLWWLKAFTGSVVLKSAFNAPQSILHELMHEVQFDGLSGALVSDLTSLQADFTRIFSDRTGAAQGTGGRSTGFISDYAESNLAEDWAEVGSTYRFDGELFRFWAAVDTARGDRRLQDKYDFAKRFFKGKEFSHYGNLKYGDGLFSPLVLFWNPASIDNVVGAEPGEVARRMSSGFDVVGVEGWVFTRLIDGTVPLRVYRHAVNDDFAVAGSATIQRDLLAKGYFDTGVVAGYAFADARPNTTPLKAFYNRTRKDYSTVASDYSLGTHRDAEYTEIGVDVHVLMNPFY